MIHIDFVPPTTNDCSLLPEPATFGDTLRYVVSVSESLASAPSLTVTGDAGDLFTETR